MKNFLKRIVGICLTLVIIFSGAILLGGCASRDEILRLYVPGEYVDDIAISGFETWYKETTGKNITVVKKEFDTNETMYTMIATKRQDFDIICPSDYMVERLKKENLLVKIDSEIMSIIKANVVGALIDEETGDFIINEETGEFVIDANNNNLSFMNLVQSSFDPNFEYASPYMWGTMGIMYYFNGDLNNKQEVDIADSKKSSWRNLFDVNERKIYMKDSERDSYTVALFNYYYDELKELSNNFTNFENEQYQELLTNIFTLGDDFDEKLEQAKTILTNQKKYVYDYESDEGKDALLTSKGAQGYYGAFWSCDAGYIMADFSGDEPVYNENFRYIVAEEGSNVWIDSFCISKYAGNKKAAEMFMLYMSDPEVAFNCMDYTGCTSSIYNATVDYFNYLMPEDINDPELTEDDWDEVFYNCSDAFKSNYLSLMFPHLDIDIGDYHISSPLNRCGIMRDLDIKANDDLLKMWTNLRRFTA